MKINLNIEKFCLRGIITSSYYSFKEKKDEYNKLCVIMDRLEDTVDLLNALELPNDKNRKTFIIT